MKVLGREDEMKKYNEEFLSIAQPIINHETYDKMKYIKHHNESVYEHCMDTAYVAYRISKKMGMDYVATTRGSLLHDFYLYKFKKGKGLQFFSAPLRHARNHPLVALENAGKYFELNHKEKDIIKNHMFPIGMPRSGEAWIVTFVDKFLAVHEYSTRVKNMRFSKREVELGA